MKESIDKFLENRDVIIFNGSPYLVNDEECYSITERELINLLEDFHKQQSIKPTIVLLEVENLKALVHELRCDLDNYGEGELDNVINTFKKLDNFTFQLSEGKEEPKALTDEMISDHVFKCLKGLTVPPGMLDFGNEMAKWARNFKAPKEEKESEWNKEPCEEGCNCVDVCKSMGIKFTCFESIKDYIK